MRRDEISLSNQVDRVFISSYSNDNRCRENTYIVRLYSRLSRLSLMMTLSHPDRLIIFFIQMNDGDDDLPQCKSNC